MNNLDFGTSPSGPPNLTLIFGGLMAVMALAVIETNIMNTSLPRIVTDLGGLSHLAWVVTAFLLASTIAAPLYGKLSDLYGRRRLMTISIVIFLMGSVLCGVAGSMGQLIVFRAVQGLGAGGLITLVQATIGDLVAPKDRARYKALFTVVFAISSLIGPLIGGALTTYFSWRWIFFVNLPFGAVALGLIRFSLPPLRVDRRPVIDFLGAALLVVTTTACLAAFNSLTGEAASASVILGLIFAIGLFLLIKQERRAAEPILEIDLFGNRIFVIGACTTATMAFGLFAALLLLPLYLQLVVGQTPIAAAMIVTPQIVGMVLSSFAGARFANTIDRIPYLLIVGVLFQALGLWGLVIGTSLQLPIWAFSVIAFLLGAGMGLGMPNAVAIVQNAVGRTQMGVATGSLSFFRSLGGAAGVAISGGIVTLALRLALSRNHFGVSVQQLIDHGTSAGFRLSPLQHASYIDAYRHAILAGFTLCAVVISGAFVFALFLPRAIAHSQKRSIALETVAAGGPDEHAELSVADAPGLA
jgi:EmrB/QacA subfamily drug resistance transporter